MEQQRRNGHGCEEPAVAIEPLRLADRGRVEQAMDDLRLTRGLGPGVAADHHVLDRPPDGEPLSVADVSRARGITRQSVQRVADILVDRGLAEYLPNPAHRRAKLLRPTDAGYDAVRRIDPQHARFARRLAGALGEDELEATLDSLQRLSRVLDQLASAPQQTASP